MKPKELEFTSRRVGYQRFQTAAIRKLLVELEQAEENKKQAITPFVCGIFEQFHSTHLIWTQLVRCLSELDCLYSLAIISNADEPMCRPQFENRNGLDNRPYLELRNSRNPCISATGINFIPNDIVLGGVGNAPCCLLVTGPNMGGKSTILRQTCIAVLMAQIGCFCSCN